MTETTDDPSFQNIRDIIFRDAASRAEMWADFAKEFARLGMLAAAMRGPTSVIDAALAGAKSAREEMDREIKIAESGVPAL